MTIEPIDTSRKTKRPRSFEKGWYFAIGFALGVIGGVILMS